jgi:Spx/MgsR family transcriptional regulator
MFKIYGINNCSTVKKALQFLSDNGVGYEFIDYKKSPITKEKLIEFVSKSSWQQVLNSKGMTYRALEEKQKPQNEKAAIAIMLEKNSIIKRPIIENSEGEILIGFSEELYRKFCEI